MTDLHGSSAGRRERMRDPESLPALMRTSWIFRSIEDLGETPLPTQGRWNFVLATGIFLIAVVLCWMAFRV